MKKLTVSLLATLAVALLSSPSFAANANDKDGMAVSENPTLIERSFLIDQYGVAPAFSDRQVKDQIEVAVNPIMTERSFLTEEYGVAPAWNDRQIKVREERLENPTLRAINDNVE